MPLKLGLQDYVTINDSDMITPMAHSVEMFELQQKWFDKKAYQRKNHQDACTALKIADPNHLHIHGMIDATALKF